MSGLEALKNPAIFRHMFLSPGYASTHAPRKRGAELRKRKREKYLFGELQGRRVKLFSRPHCPSRLTLFILFFFLHCSVCLVHTFLPSFLHVSFSGIILVASAHTFCTCTHFSFPSLSFCYGTRIQIYNRSYTRREEREKKIVRSFRNKGRDINSLLFSSEIDFSPPPPLSSPLECKWVFNGGPSISFSLPPPHLDLPSFGSRKYPLN